MPFRVLRQIWLGFNVSCAQPSVGGDCFFWLAIPLGGIKQKIPHGLGRTEFVRSFAVGAGWATPAVFHSCRVKVGSSMRFSRETFN